MKKDFYFFISKIIFLAIFIGLTQQEVYPYKKQKPIVVGVYSDKGVGEWGKEQKYAQDISLIISGLDRNIKTVLIDSAKIKNGILNSLNVVLFPGGSAGVQSKGLGKEGRKKLRSFVKAGGGYIGICAGAYLAQSYDTDFSWRSLKISPAKFANDTKHWNRGAGIVKVGLTSKARDVFPEIKRLKYIYLFYSHGPLLVPIPNHKKSFEKIFLMKSNVYHDNINAKGESPGTTMLLRNHYGKGRVVLSSVHPEFTPGLRWMLPRLIRWAAKSKYIRYPWRFIVINKYKREVMFTSEWKQLEAQRLETALNKTSSARKKLFALRKLIDMRSINLCEHYPDLMDDPSPDVRKKAAEIVHYYDYFPAISYLRKALKNEKRVSTRKYIKRAFYHLNGIKD